MENGPFTSNVPHKTTIQKPGIFQPAMELMTPVRVNPIKSHEKPPFSYGFPMVYWSSLPVPQEHISKFPSCQAPGMIRLGGWHAAGGFQRHEELSEELEKFDSWGWAMAHGPWRAMDVQGFWKWGEIYVGNKNTNLKSGESGRSKRHRFEIMRYLNMIEVIETCG